MWLLMLGASVAHAGGCDEAAPVAALVAEINAGEAAFVAVDRASFEDSAARAEALFACVDRPLERGEAALVHRLHAISRFLEGDKAGSERAWRAARQADRGLRAPELPEVHPLRAGFEAAAPGPGERRRTLTVPAGAQLLVDGMVADQVPTERPFVAQYVVDGATRWTGYVEDGAREPDLVALGLATPQALAKARRGEGRSPEARAGVGRWIAAGAAGALAAGLYGGALASKSQFTRLDGYVDDGQGGGVATLDESDRLRARTNTLALSAGGAAAVAVGLGAWAVVTVSF